MSYPNQPAYPPQPERPQDPWQTTSHLHAQVPPPQAWAPPPTTPQKKPRIGLLIGLVVGAGVLLCGGTVTVLALAGQPTGHTIRFEVTTAGGTASLINWSTLEDAAVEQNVPATAAAPWVMEVNLEDQLGLVGVNASAADGKNVACKLFVDGKLVDEASGDGSVNCSDTVS
jgi:hypothetical protein